MRIGIVIPHDGDSGGVRHLKRIASGLSERDHQVETMIFRAGPGNHQSRGPFTRWQDITLASRSLQALICPGDLPLWRLEPYVPDSCQLFSFHLHLGMHDWIAEEGNIRSPRIQKATSARWIQERIERMGVTCSWFGAAPFDDDLYEESPDRALRIGTLAHSWYGWKNTRAVVESLSVIQRQFPSAELWSYGQTPMAMPGRFFLKPDLVCLRFIYSHCRVWVVPSISEGLGMCGFEAMLCRAPVVSADNRGIREFADENTCLLYPPRDLGLMHSHVLRLLADWDYGTMLASRAWDTVSRLSFNDCLDRIEVLLAGGICH